MPSILELIHLSSTGTGDEPGINELATQAKIKGRGSMSKAEKICALADELLSDEAEAIVKASSSDLVGRARAGDVSGYSTMSKSELQEHFLRSLGVGPTASPGSNGAAGYNPTSRSPQSAAEVAQGAPVQGAPQGVPAQGAAASGSHFESEEARRHAIHDAAHQALDAALNEKQSYIVVESFRPSDAADPLRIQPSYIQRHLNTAVVLEIMVPHHQIRR